MKSVALKSTSAALRRLAVFWALAASLHALSITAEAHDPGLSAAELQVEAGRLTARLTFARADVETIIGPQRQTRDEAVTLRDLAASALEIAVGGNRLQAATIETRVDESTGAVQFRLEYPWGGGRSLSVHSTLLGSLPRGHRQYLSIKDQGGSLLGEAMLDDAHRVLETDLIAATEKGDASFRQFLFLGLEHILTGYDHLVFLLGLIIAGSGFRSAAKIITSFTVAHSMTLALAALDLVRISPRVTEPLIAASIVYVGIENVFRRDFGRRWLLTFGFGLVHGFGFASVLKEMGIGTRGLGAAIPLMSFNLGVELGQISIAALAVPVIWKLREQPAFVRRYVPACSLAIGITGGFWLIERLVH